jgi:hypothetical protein
MNIGERSSVTLVPSSETTMLKETDCSLVTAMTKTVAATRCAWQDFELDCRNINRVRPQQAPDIVLPHQALLIND